MAADSGQAGSTAGAGPVAVYGATGVAGGLVARELRRLGAEIVLAGRSSERLAALSEELGDPRLAAVELDDAEGLRALLASCAAVVGCAGPFGRNGEPLVAAAADAGTHYLDITSEQGFIRTVFDEYGERAAANGAVLVPGMGFEFALGDMLAALAADGMGPLDELALATCVDQIAPTPAMMLSAFEEIGGADLVWEGGRLRRGPWHLDGGRWEFAEPVGRQRVMRSAGGEHIMVPRHIETERVRTVSGSWVTPLAPGRMLMLRLMLRSPLRRWIDSRVRRRVEPAEELARRGTWFTIECSARAGGRSRLGIVSGGDIVAVAAASVARGALLCSAPGFEARGALAPAEAFAPEPFLAGLADAGVSFAVEDAASPVASPASG